MGFEVGEKEGGGGYDGLEMDCVGFVLVVLVEMWKRRWTDMLDLGT